MVFSLLPAHPSETIRRCSYRADPAKLRSSRRNFLSRKRGSIAHSLSFSASHRPNIRRNTVERDVKSQVIHSSWIRVNLLKSIKAGFLVPKKFYFNVISVNLGVVGWCDGAGSTSSSGASY